MPNPSDDELIAFAKQNNIAIPKTQSAQPSDAELLAFAQQSGARVPPPQQSKIQENGGGVSGLLSAIKNTDWVQAVKDEATKPMDPNASAMVRGAGGLIAAPAAAQAMLATAGGAVASAVPSALSKATGLLGNAVNSPVGKVVIGSGKTLPLPAYYAYKLYKEYGK